MAIYLVIRIRSRLFRTGAAAGGASFRAITVASVVTITTVITINTQSMVFVLYRGPEP
jgi:hypothetical protein